MAEVNWNIMIGKYFFRSHSGSPLRRLPSSFYVALCEIQPYRSSDLCLRCKFIIAISINFILISSSGDLIDVIDTSDTDWWKARCNKVLPFIQLYILEPDCMFENFVFFMIHLKLIGALMSKADIPLTGAISL